MLSFFAAVRCARIRSSACKLEEHSQQGITWEEAEVATQNNEWLWSVAQCIHLDAG